MAERPALWPLLLYAVLIAIAGSRPAPPVSRAAARPYPKDLPRSEADGVPAAATQADSDKRPREHFENDQPLVEQKRRSREPGRGRRATTPWQIPWAGWKDVFWRVYASINDNRLLAVAAGVVFYSLLAVFPAVAAFVSLYGIVADASTIDAHLSLASGILPGGAVDLLHEQITKLAAKSNDKLSFGFIAGLALGSGAPMPG